MQAPARPLSAWALVLFALAAVSAAALLIFASPYGAFEPTSG
jgi:hypothetical protein